MASTRSPLFPVALLAFTSGIVGCGGSQPVPPVASAPLGAAAASCIALPRFAVVEVGLQPQADNKKVADNCWWQQPVPDIDGLVGEGLGWQFCNSCNVPVEFKFSDLPAHALAGCSLWTDASGSTAPVAVPAGQTEVEHCTALLVARQEYSALARPTNGGYWVQSDPELEIEGVPLVPNGVGRLAQVEYLSQCLSTPLGAGDRRLTLSGRFARLNASSAVVLIPAGPGLFATRWGGDLVELGTIGAATTADAASDRFSVTADLPSYVTEFTVRYDGQQSTSRIADISACP